MKTLIYDLFLLVGVVMFASEEVATGNVVIKNLKLRTQHIIKMEHLVQEVHKCLLLNK